MKKIISILLLITVCLSLGFAASKKGKSNNIKLDPKNKFAIEGVELGSIDLGLATITTKGEIFWSQSADGQWRETGWDIRGIDLSAYAGIRIELAKGQQFENIDLALSNPAVTDDWCFKFDSKGVAYIYFNGTGRSWGDMKNPDPEEGFALRLNGEVASYRKTIIKSVELIRKEDMPDNSALNLLGSDFGTCSQNAKLNGNEITWAKNQSDCFCGWDLTDIDLSEYDRIRIELESNTAEDLRLVLADPDWGNWDVFTYSEPNVLEADLSGEGGDCDDPSYRFDKSDGLRIFIGFWINPPYKNERKTVVKSVQLLKGKDAKNENLKLLGSNFGSYAIHAFALKDGIIQWKKTKDGWGLAGWKVKGLDFSGYSKIRIELGPEAAQQDIKLKFEQDDDRCAYFSAISPTVLEANLDGSGNSGDDGKPWDPSKGINQILIQFSNLKKDQTTTVKSITLITDEQAQAEPSQPDDIVLNGVNLGSIKENAWINENFAINWKVIRDGYAQCGWRFDSLEGDILVIKVSATDVPLRLRIRDYANENESSYVDDGSHLFVINLKNKKQQSKKNWKDSEWDKKPKTFDFSQGGDIVLEPYNGVFKEDKKTVVEYIRVE